MLFGFKKVLLIFFIFSSQINVNGAVVADRDMLLLSDGDLVFFAIKRVGDSLHLSCKLPVNALVEASGPFLWNIIPYGKQNYEPLDVPVITAGRYSNITLHNIGLDDSGVYHCSLPPYSANTIILVQPKQTNCARGGLTCGTRCIFGTYLCDGVVDCEESEDEDPWLCGHRDPCEVNRTVKCHNLRCIPRTACCYATKNCLPHPCCAQFNVTHNIDMDYPKADHHPVEDSPFIESTIYIVSACALIFFVAVVGLITAACRMHLKRAQYPLPPGAFDEMQMNNVSSDVEEASVQFFSGNLSDMFSTVETDRAERFHLNLPLFTPRRPCPRPDTPNIVEVELNRLERVQPTAPSVDDDTNENVTTGGPPTYAEVIANFIGPPPHYHSRDNLLCRIDVNGNPPLDLPPQYDDNILHTDGVLFDV